MAFSNYKENWSPVWFGSAVRASACRPSMFLSLLLPFSLPLYLKVNKKYPWVRININKKGGNRNFLAEHIAIPIKNGVLALLADLAQWLECWPVVQRNLGLVPARGRYLSCSLSPALVGLCGRQPLDVSLSRRCFSLLPSLSEQKMEKCPQVRVKKKGGFC
uniref:Uncharacterized protein n=1 Tax=Molossus molossus TaxID=27622 RepID=A0A7J8JVQ9_MOLMO|nr:hypothetical protein HJG59_007969 [Molossus molossus]